MGKLSLTYQDYGKLIDDAVVRLSKENKHFTAVYGLPRGGLPIAVHISHHLDIPLVTNLTQFRQEHGGNGILLIVDDIVDTGKTFDRVLELTEILNIEYFTFTLFYKTRTTYIPNMYLVETQSWIIFPWETYEEKPSEYHQDVYSELFNDGKEK